MADQFGVRIDGVRQLVRSIGVVDSGLRTEIGQANKAIGQRIIDSAFPRPESVGAGVGAKPRASGSATVLRILAGGPHRKHRAQQWGKRVVPRQGKRPYIRKAAERNMRSIERDYRNALRAAARRAGIDTRI